MSGIVGGGVLERAEDVTCNGERSALGDGGVHRRRRRGRRAAGGEALHGRGKDQTAGTQGGEHIGLGGSGSGGVEGGGWRSIGSGSGGASGQAVGGRRRAWGWPGVAATVAGMVREQCRRRQRRGLRGAVGGRGRESRKDEQQRPAQRGRTHTQTNASRPRPRWQQGTRRDEVTTSWKGGSPHGKVVHLHMESWLLHMSPLHGEVRHVKLYMVHWAGHGDHDEDKLI
ncbi:hypothetical protein C8R44DRAFT_737182 [Mycena epipterygia]|nr:hypothetical protein C8R44DRAFT_737182 [Mycena epipterygia]